MEYAEPSAPQESHDSFLSVPDQPRTGVSGSCSGRSCPSLASLDQQDQEQDGQTSPAVILPALPDAQFPGDPSGALVGVEGGLELDVGTGTRFSAGLAMGLGSDLLDPGTPQDQEIRARILHRQKDKTEKGLPMRALALEASGGSNVAGPAIRVQGDVRAQSSEYGGGSAGYHSGLWDPRETSAQDCSPTSPDLGFFRSMLPLPIDRMGRGVVSGASEMTLQAILASSAGDARRQTRMESRSSRSWEGALGDASAALTHPGTGASTATVWSTAWLWSFLAWTMPSSQVTSRDEDMSSECKKVQILGT